MFSRKVSMARGRTVSSMAPPAASAAARPDGLHSPPRHRPAFRLEGPSAEDAPVAQLDRALPSEGKGHTFESCRVRHYLQ